MVQRFVFRLNISIKVTQVRVVLIWSGKRPFLYCLISFAPSPWHLLFISTILFNPLTAQRLTATSRVDLESGFICLTYWRSFSTGWQMSCQDCGRNHILKWKHTFSLYISVHVFFFRYPTKWSQWTQCHGSSCTRIYGNVILTQFHKLMNINIIMYIYYDIILYIYEHVLWLCRTLIILDRYTIKLQPFLAIQTHKWKQKFKLPIKIYNHSYFWRSSRIAICKMS